MIIQGDMLSHADTGKYICIVKDTEVDKGLPIYVRSKYSIHWPNGIFSEEDFKILLYDIFDCDTEPELGEIPAFIKEKMPVKKVLNRNIKRYWAWIENRWYCLGEILSSTIFCAHVSKVSTFL